EGDRRGVDQPAAIEAQAFELRQRLAFDLVDENLELVDARGEDRLTLSELGDTPFEPRPPNESQHEVRACEALLEPRLLVRNPRALVLELGELRGDRVEPTSALRERGLAERRALPLLPLHLEVAHELLEPLRARIPEMSELEVDHRIRGRDGIGQQPLETFELLLRARDREILFLELVEQLVTFAAQVAKLPLHRGAVPIELQQLLVGTLRRSTRREESENHGSRLRGEIGRAPGRAS